MSRYEEAKQIYAYYFLRINITVPCIQYIISEPIFEATPCVPRLNCALSPHPIDPKSPLLYSLGAIPYLSRKCR